MDLRTLLEVIGWIGSALIVISLMLSRVLRFRWMNLTGSLIAAAYNAILGIWPFVAMNAAIVVINAFWLLRLYRTQHDEATYQVVEVSPDDAYLLHLQHHHAADISQFAPGFHRLPALDETRISALVIKGSETVGMVEILDCGDGVGRVLLDWVLPRFRDFRPGEFVFRDSGLFTRHGFRQLRVTDDVPGNAKYLERLGFTRDADGWAYVVPPTP